MPVLAAARCSQFLDYLGRDYPGFISLSCNYSSLDQSGLITWEGTAEIAWVPSNPSDIDNRKNKTTWCFGRVVDLRVINDSGSYERPKCIPKMYIYKALYNPRTERLRLELRDILGLLRDRSIDDFRNDFDDENAIEKPLEEDEPIACGFPDDEEFNEDEFTQQDEKKDKYWWEQWQREGTERNIRIISEIMRRLRIPLQGTVSGEIRLPFTPSGSLVGVCGDLAFKSLTPSYIWSNYQGVAVISRININPPREKFYISGVQDIDYNPIENGLNPISELIVTGRVKELDENTPQEEADENGNPMHCEIITENGPETAVLPDGNPFFHIDLSVTTICEVVEQFKKTITTTRKERYGLLFPDSTIPGVSPMMWVDLSYKKIEEQFYDGCTGALVKKIITEYNVWGKVFGEFYDGHPNFYIDPYEFGIENTNINLSTIPPFADWARFNTTLVKDRTETIKYYYNRQKLNRIETTVEEPISKVLVDYHDALPGNPPEIQYFLNGYQITSSSTEIWYEWGNNHQNHILIERDCLNRQNRDSIARREQYLQQSIIDSEGASAIPTFEQQMYFRATPSSETTELYTFSWDKSLVTPAERLALIEKRTISDNSREGMANPPATEYLPRGKANQPNKNATEKWIEKPVVYRKKWEDAKCSEWLPSREIVDLGEVATEEIIDAVGRVIYYLRQGQSLIHELFLPLTQDWITGVFKPTFRVDVRECENTYCHLAHGISMEFTQKENMLLLELLWLGETGVSSPITSTQRITSYAIASLPPASQGILYFNGVPVTTSQQIPIELIDQLTFTPSSTFTGTTFSYSATDGVTSGSTLVVGMVPPSGVNPIIVSDSESLTATVVVSDQTIVSLPTDLESNAIAVTTTTEDEFTYSYQLKDLLRRLKSDIATRLSLELSDRVRIYR